MIYIQSIPCLEQSCDLYPKYTMFRAVLWSISKVYNVYYQSSPVIYIKSIPCLLPQQSCDLCPKYTMFITRAVLWSISKVYGKFFFSSNTLAVRTPKIILKLLLNSSHAVRDLGRVRQYPPWLLFAAFVESVGCPRYNPQKTSKQWRTRDRRFHWLWGWFPDLKIIFMM